MANTTLENLLRDSGFQLGGERKYPKPAKSGLPVAAVINLSAAVLAIGASAIASFGSAPAWVWITLIGLVAASVAAELAQYLFSPARGWFQGLRRGRIARRLARQAVDLARRAEVYADLPRRDGLASVLYGFNQSGIYGPHSAPDCYTARLAFAEAGLLLSDASRGHGDPVKALRMFDRIMSIFNRVHVKEPGDIAASARDRLTDAQRGEIQRARTRYDAFGEDFKRLAEAAERDLGLNLGGWCYDMPAYV